MFWAVYRSSSRALIVFAASGLHTYVNQRLQIQLELLMMSGVPLETCWAFNERWNNKFYYKVASCWLFPLNHIMYLLQRINKSSPSPGQIAVSAICHAKRVIEVFLLILANLVQENVFQVSADLAETQALTCTFAFSHAFSICFK